MYVVRYDCCLRLCEGVSVWNEPANALESARRKVCVTGQHGDCCLRMHAVVSVLIVPADALKSARREELEAVAPAAA